MKLNNANNCTIDNIIYDFNKTGQYVPVSTTKKIEKQLPTHKSLLDYFDYGVDIDYVVDNRKFRDEEEEVSENLSCKLEYLNNIKSNDCLIELIQNVVGKNIIEKLDNSYYVDKYLLLSSGKDSMFIFSVLEKFGLIDEFIFITFMNSDSNKDESAIVANILKKYNAKHIIINPNSLSRNKIIDYLRDTPRVNADPTSIMFSLLGFIKPNSLLIDGMGNDVYIGHMPSLKMVNRFRIAQIIRKISGKNLILNRNVSPWACVGLRGEGWFNNSVHNRYDFLEIGFEDYESYRARVRGQLLDQEVFMWKTINFGYKSSCDVFFPWSSRELSRIVSCYGKTNFYKIGQNKYPLRKFLSEKYGLDFDKIGKRGFSTTADQMSIIHPSSYSELSSKIKSIIPMQS